MLKKFNPECDETKLNPANPYGFNAETLAAMDDAETGHNLSGPYSTTAEMWEDIFVKDDYA